MSVLETGSSGYWRAAAGDDADVPLSVCTAALLEAPGDCAAQLARRLASGMTNDGTDVVAIPDDEKRQVGLLRLSSEGNEAGMPPCVASPVMAGVAECVAFNADASCAVVGDSTGVVHFIRVIDGSIIFSQQIFDPRRAVPRASAELDAPDATAESKSELHGARRCDAVFAGVSFTRQSQSSGDESLHLEELIVLSTYGAILRFSELSMPALAAAAGAAVSDGDDSAVTAVRRTIKVHKASSVAQLSEGIADIAAVTTPAATMIAVAGAGECCLGLWDGAHGGGAAAKRGTPVMPLRGSIASTALGCAASRVCISLDGRLIVLLGSNGTVSSWSADSLRIAAAWSHEGITDIATMPRIPREALGRATSSFTSKDHTAASRIVAVSNCNVVVARVESSGFTVESTVSLASLGGNPVAPLEAANFVPSTLSTGTTSVYMTWSAGVREAELHLLRVGVEKAGDRVEAMVESGDVDAAHAWASAHGMDPEEVLIARARLLSRAISHSSRSEEKESSGDAGGAAAASSAKAADDSIPDTVEDDMIRSLFALLDGVHRDVRFVCDICTSTRVSSVAAVEQLLDYAARRCSAAPVPQVGSPHQSDEEAMLACEEVVENCSRRFVTYQLLHAAKARFDSERWQHFRVADLAREVSALLSKGMMRAVTVIWRRHGDADLAGSIVRTGVRSLPIAVPVTTYVSWLRDEIVPRLCRGSDRCALAGWLVDRAVLVESRETRPHNALHIATVLDGPSPTDMLASEASDGAGEAADDARLMQGKVDTVLAQRGVRATSMKPLQSPGTASCTALSSVGFATQVKGPAQLGAALEAGADCTCARLPGESDSGQCHGGYKSVGRLCKLVSLLREAVYLWDVHAYPVRLDTLLAETSTDFGVALLDRAPDAQSLLGYTGHIERHVRPWCHRHAIDCDGLLVEYVGDLCSSLGSGGSDPATNSVLESRALAIIDSIQRGSPRVDATLTLLHAVKPPYSRGVLALVDKALHWPSKRVDEVREQRRLMGLHTVLARYGVRGAFNLASEEQATMLLQHVVARTYAPSALHDALCFADAFSHIHKQTVHALFLQNMISEPLRLFEVQKGLEVAMAHGYSGDVGLALDAVLAARARRVSSPAILFPRGRTSSEQSEAAAVAAGAEAVQYCLEALESMSDVSQNVEAAKKASVRGGVEGRRRLPPLNIKFAPESEAQLECPSAVEKRVDGAALDASLEDSAEETKANLTSRTGGEFDFAHFAADDADDWASPVLPTSRMSSSQVEERVPSPPTTVAFGDDDSDRQWGAACYSRVGYGLLQSLLRLPSQSHPAKHLTAEVHADEKATGVGTPRSPLSVVSGDVLAELRRIADLQAEFGIVVGMRQLRSTADKSTLLRAAVRPVIDETLKLEGHQAVTATHRLGRVFRMAELLGVGRMQLRGVIARECASSGDVLAAMYWCNGLSQNSYGGGSPEDIARVLREVSIALSEYVTSNPSRTFKVTPHSTNQQGRALARAPELSRALLQQSLVDCTIDDLPKTHDLWQAADMTAQVLEKTEVGEYGRLWEQRPGDGSTQDRAGMFNFSALLEYSVVDRSESSAATSTQADTAGSIAGNGGVGVSNTDQSTAHLVNESWFKDSCMVLDTQTAMAYTQNFVASQRRGSAAHARFDVESGRSGRDRRHPRGRRGERPLGRGGDPAAEGFTDALAQFLAEHEAPQLAIRVYSTVPVQTEAQVVQFEGLMDGLLSRVLRSKVLDHEIALGYMLALRMKSSFSAFKASLPSVMSDFDRLAALSRLGIDAAQAWGQDSFLAECRALHLNAMWWSYLERVGVAFDPSRFRTTLASDHASTTSVDHIQEIMPHLLEASGFNLPLACRFCGAYGIDEEFAKLIYIEHLLVHAQGAVTAEYASKIRSIGATVRADSLVKVLTAIVDRLAPYDYEHLSLVYSILNAADAGNSDVRDRMVVLEILQNYDANRVRRPFPSKARPQTTLSRSMLDEQPSTGPYSATEGYDSDASGRLPFHELFSDPWSVLRCALTPDSVTRLIGLSAPLRLEPDLFYAVLVERMVDALSEESTRAPVDAKQTPAASGTPESWSLGLSFDDVRAQLVHIRGLDRAVECAEAAATALPPGQDRLEAFRFAADLASTWVASTRPPPADTRTPDRMDRIRTRARRAGLSRRGPTSAGESKGSEEDEDAGELSAAEETADRLQLAAKTCATEVQLLNFGAHFADLIPFADRPFELICELFDRKAISAVLTGATVVDLHAVALEISVRHEVDLNRAKSMMVQRWITDGYTLETKSKAADGDTSATTDRTERGRESDTIHGSGATTSESRAHRRGSGTGGVFVASADEERLQQEYYNELRIVFTLSPPASHVGRLVCGRPIASCDEGARALLKLAFMKPSGKPTYRARSRALSAVFALLPREKLDELYPDGADALAGHWKLTRYLADFEELGIPHDVDSLRRCSKPSLARGLWRDHRQSPRVVRLICSLLLDYNVCDTHLWLAVLKHMVSLGMYRQLLVLLESLSTRNLVRADENLGAVWQSVLLQPFEEAKLRGADCEDLVSSSADDDTQPTGRSADAGWRWAVEPRVVGAWRATKDGCLRRSQSHETIAVFEQVVVLVQCCPVLKYVDISRLVVGFRNLGSEFYSHAVRCAMMLPDPAVRSAAIKRALRDETSFPALLDVFSDAVASIDVPLDADSGEGIANQLRHEDGGVVEAIFDAVDAADAHAALVGTPYLTALARFLARRGRIRNMLLASLRAHRLTDAIGLVHMYHAYHPEAPSRAGSPSKGDDDSTGPLRRFIVAELDADTEAMALLDEVCAELHRQTHASPRSIAGAGIVADEEAAAAGGAGRDARLDGAAAGGRAAAHEGAALRSPAGGSPVGPGVNPEDIDLLQ